MSAICDNCFFNAVPERSLPPSVPSVCVHPVDVAVTAGRPAEFNVVVAGQPEPRVTFLKGKQSMRNNERTVIGKLVVFAITD